MVVVVLILTSFMAIHIWIGQSLRENIKLAKEQYNEQTEEALISYMLDESKPTKDRTHDAIWTLGQITDDPKGETCYGKHDSVLCQYEIHKAIVAIEKNWWFSHPRLAKAE